MSKLMLVDNTCTSDFFGLSYNLEIILFPHDLYEGTNLGLTEVNIE